MNSITSFNADYNEALSAKEYFSHYHDGLNRRVDDPINSRLNYGYAVVRGYIARTLVATGFHPTFGLHHDSQLNSFNLADDLIEPFRAIVDLIANDIIGSNTILSKTERREITSVLHNACIIDNTKVNVMSAINIMIESLKRIILSETHEELKLPLILPIENMRIAPEVFMRIVQNRKASEKHFRRIQPHTPKTGTVRMLRLTEKQFDNITMITGEPDYQEMTVGPNCNIVI